MDGELAQDTARPWIQERWSAAYRGLALYALSTVAGVSILYLMLSSLSMLTVGIGLLLFPLFAALGRKLTNKVRELVGRWTGVPIPAPYLRETLAEPKQPGLNGWFERFTRTLADQATWRDMVWMLADPFVAAFTAMLPMALIVNGVWGLALSTPLVWEPLVDWDGTQWYLFVPVSDQTTALAAVPVGLAQIAIGIVYAPRLLKVYGRWCRVLLAPTEKARLALRVKHLTETRSDAVDVSAAELRRIERDLHDGAQARLVAMGMSLGAIEHLLEKDPAKAKLLLAEARKSSVTALSELRDLVRGIHPPVLADRGLVDAVRALALDSPLRVEVAADVPGRLEPPVESAAYFAVAELLANVGKHAGAGRAWIDIRYERGTLRIGVTDDGHGGASLDGGTGLRGIERRIGTFDGVLALNSPAGGPTLVTLELPCTIATPLA